MQFCPLSRLELFSVVPVEVGFLSCFIGLVDMSKYFIVGAVWDSIFHSLRWLSTGRLANLILYVHMVAESSVFCSEENDEFSISV